MFGSKEQDVEASSLLSADPSPSPRLASANTRVSVSRQGAGAGLHKAMKGSYRYSWGAGRSVYLELSFTIKGARP